MIKTTLPLALCTVGLVEKEQIECPSFDGTPAGRDKGMEGRSVDFLYTICRYIATIHTDIVEKLTRSVEIVSQKNGHYFLNQHYLYKDRLYLLVRQDLLK